MTTTTDGTHQNASTTDQTHRYMWVITVQWPIPQGHTCGTFRSTVDVPPGASRVDIFSQVFALVERETGVTGPIVLFFSLEPDQLNG